MLRVLGPMSESDGQLEREDAMEGLDQLICGALTKLRISGVGHAAAGADLGAQRALGGEGDAIIGRLSVDEEAASARAEVGDFRAGGVPLLADDEEQGNLHTLIAQALGRGNLRGDDALGVAGAASVDVVFVFAGGDERRNGIGVCGEDHVRGFRRLCARRR